MIGENNFSNDTRGVGQLRSLQASSREDERQTAENVSGFFKLLAAWDQAQHSEIDSVGAANRELHDVV
jgi:hypothetical protein